MEDGLDGIDFGDLGEVLDAVVRDQEQAADDADDGLALRREYGGWCAHDRAAINEGTRSLICRKCGAALDPFDFLMRLTREPERWITQRKQAEERARQSQDRLQESLRLERNAKARLRRLKER